MAGIIRPAKGIDADSAERDDLDRWSEEQVSLAPERLRAEVDRLEQLGALDSSGSPTKPIFDERGRLIEENLPPDMRTGSKADLTT